MGQTVSASEVAPNSVLVISLQQTKLKQTSIPMKNALTETAKVTKNVLNIDL